MPCSCNKNKVVRAAMNAPDYDPSALPQTSSNGPWKVYSAGGAAYRFATLEDARTAAEMIGGRIVSV
jgi:hypothetical protein